jgi:hypothetical protein
MEADEEEPPVAADERVRFDALVQMRKHGQYEKKFQRRYVFVKTYHLIMSKRSDFLDDLKAKHYLIKEALLCKDEENTAEIFADYPSGEKFLLKLKSKEDLALLRKTLKVYKPAYAFERAVWSHGGGKHVEFVDTRFPGFLPEERELLRNHAVDDNIHSEAVIRRLLDCYKEYEQVHESVKHAVKIDRIGILKHRQTVLATIWCLGPLLGKDCAGYIAKMLFDLKSNEWNGFLTLEV